MKEILFLSKLKKIVWDKEGYLSINDVLFNKWRKNYFRLKGNFLFYYDDHLKLNCKGLFLLALCKIEKKFGAENVNFFIDIKNIYEGNFVITLHLIFIFH